MELITPAHYSTGCILCRETFLSNKQQMLLWLQQRNLSRCKRANGLPASHIYCCIKSVFVAINKRHNHVGSITLLRIRRRKTNKW